MRLDDPPFNRREEFLRFPHNLLGFRFSRDIRLVIIDHISLAPAPVKIVRIRTPRLSQDQSQALEGYLVVSGTGGHAMARNGDGHFRSLQGRIVRGGKTPVGGNTPDGSIRQVAGDDRPDACQLTF